MSAESTLTTSPRFVATRALQKPGTNQKASALYAKLYPDIRDLSSRDFDHLMFANEIPDSYVTVNTVAAESTDVQNASSSDGLDPLPGVIQSSTPVEESNAPDLSSSRIKVAQCSGPDHSTVRNNCSGYIDEQSQTELIGLPDSVQLGPPTRLDEEHSGAPLHLLKLGTSDTLQPQDVELSAKSPPEQVLSYADKSATIRQNELSFAEVMCGFSEDTPVWSLMTNVVSYPTIHGEQCNLQFGAAQKPVHPKKRRYRPDNQNEPHTEDPYLGVKPELTSTYDPEVDVSTTYLWSGTESSDPTIGRIAVSTDCVTLGALLGPVDRPVTVLFDSGANRTFISKSTLEKQEQGFKYPRFPLGTIKIKMANNVEEDVTEAAKVVLKLGDHCIEVIGYVMTLASHLDILIGSKSMAELEGTLEFSSMELKFRKRSLQILPLKSYTVHPGQTKTMHMQIQNVPDSFPSHVAIVCKLKSRNNIQVPNTVITPTNCGEFIMTLQNKTKKPVTYFTNVSIGIADLRSVGYYYRSREQLQRHLEVSNVANF